MIGGEEMSIFAVIAKKITIYKKNMLFKMVIAYFVLFLMMFYIMTAVLMHHANKKLSEKIYASNLNSLRILQVYCDTNLVQQVNDIILTMQLERKGKTRTHLFMNTNDKITEADVYSVYTELGTLLLENPMVDEIAVYNRKNAISLSSTMGVGYEVNSVYYEKLYNSKSSCVWKRAEDGYVNVITTFPLNAEPNKKKSCMIIKINPDELLKLMLPKNEMSGDVNFFITDKQCNTLISTAWEGIDIEFPLDANPHEVCEISIENKNYKTFYIPSEDDGLKYFYVIAPSIYEKELSELRAVSFWNIFSVSLLSFLCLMMISVWLYKPIKEIVKTLTLLRKKETPEDSLSLVNEELYNLISQSERVNGVINNNLPLIKSQMLMELVYGRMDSNTFFERLNELDCGLQIRNIVPAVIDIGRKLINAIDEKRRNFILYKICEMFENLETEDCKCITAKISDCAVMLLISFDDVSDADSFFEAIRRDLNEQGFQELNLIVGDKEEMSENTGAYFRKMLDLCKYSFIFGGGNILSTSKLLKRESRHGEINAEEIAKSLENHLWAKNAEAAGRLLNSFYSECDKNEYSYEYVKKCFEKIIQTVESFVDSVRNEDIDKFSVDDTITVNDMYEYILLTLDNILGGEALSAEAEFVEKVKKYIFANVGGEISQMAIAKKFDVTPEHLSRTFKRVNGCKFSDFVTAVKIETAAKMLCENKKITVKKAAEAVGYYNINYFTMLFKKKYNCTPSLYRKANTPKS